MPNHNHTTSREQEEIPKIFAYFELPTLKEAKLIDVDAGAANHNYMCITEDGQEFVVKFPIEETRDSLENDRIVASQLSKIGILSPIYIENSFRSFVYEGDLIAVVSSKIEGIHPRTLDTTTAHITGAALAKFHSSVTQLMKPHKGWLNPEIVMRTIENEDHEYTKQARSIIKEGLSLYDKELPRGIIHSDIHEDNIFVANDNPAQLTTILDLEEAEHNLFIVDIARTALAICRSESGFELKKDLIDSLLGGYGSIRKLTEDEVTSMNVAIRYAAGACTIWYMKNGYLDSAEKALSKAKSII